MSLPRDQHTAGAAATIGRFRFHGFELNQATSELSRDGAPVDIKPQSLAVLSYLLLHRERTVSGAELLRELWPGVVVSEGSLRQTIFELRRELEDDAEAPRIVKTVRGKGYRFVAELAVAQPEAPAVRTSNPHRSVARLFGRERELARLTAVCAEALGKSGRACLVLGEPGIGKSRLLREFADDLRAQGRTVFEAGAEQSQSAPPFWPWKQLMNGCLALADAALRTRCEQLTPAAMRALTAAETADAAKPALPLPGLDAEGFHRFDQLARLLALLSSETPCVLLLDDLHWADEASLVFLAHLAPLLASTRVLLVLGCRPPDRRAHRPLARALEALQRGPCNERLVLGRLSSEAIGDMLTAHGTPVSDERVREIEALGQGNPLFSLELVRWAATTGRQAGFDPHANAQLELLSLIRARLELLPEACQRVAALASVIGRDFTLAEIAALLGLSPSEALGHVDLCLRLGAFAARSELRYGFAHPLLQKAAYEAIERPERCALHLVFAQALEARGPDGSLGHMHELAHHYFQASAMGGAARAFQYNLRCAERAHGAMAYEAARDHYERALECGALLADLSAERRLALEVARAEAMRALAPDSERLGQALVELWERAEALDQPALMARAALAYTGHLPARFVPTRLAAGSDAREIALLERALERLPPEHHALRVLLLCSLSYSVAYSREHARVPALLREALHVSDELDTPTLTARVLLLQIYVGAAPGTLPERLLAADRLVELTDRHGLLELELEARVARTLCRLSAIDADGAAEDALRARQLAHELGSRHAHGRALVPALFRSLLEGDLDEAERLTLACYEAAGEDINQRNIWVARTSWITSFRSDSMHAAVELFEGMLRTFPRAVGVHAVLASAYAGEGQRELAERHFDAIARDDFKALPRGVNWLTELSLLADAACRLGDKRRAQSVYDALLPHANELAISGGEIGPGLPISHWLGDLATVLGEFECAQTWLRRAREGCQKLNAPFMLQYSAMAEARLLFVSARQVEVARQLAHDVVAFAERTGAGWLRRGALALEQDSLALRERMMSERTLRPRPLRALDDAAAPAGKRPR